jgi:hypothetical protein
MCLRKEMAGKFIVSIFIFLMSLIPSTGYAEAVETTDETKGSKIVRINKDETRYEVSEDVYFIYEKPKPFDFVANTFGNLKAAWNNSFRKENSWIIAGVAASTALMIAYDQEIMEETQRFGDEIGIEPKSDQTKTFVSIGGANVIRLPTDAGSAMYFIGDGWTQLMLASTFLGYGLIADDNRAIQTASQTAEAIISAGVVVQILKHTTGRETPNVSTVRGGNWTFFPNQVDYYSRTPHYDAFPSGHLTTAMATIVVIADNYPEYTFIRPVGYVALGLVSFQMVNNGVHWAADYPLALALGYTFGKIAVARGKKEERKKSKEPNQKVSIFDSLEFSVQPIGARDIGIGVTYNY